MNKYIINIKLLAVVFVLTGFASCNLFRDEPVDKLSVNSIWKNELLLDEYMLPMYRNMNDGFSVYMPTNGLLKGASRVFLPWYGDQITVSKTNWYNTAYGDILKGNIQEITRWGLTTWTSYYSRIQAINLLFENKDNIPEGEHKQRILGEAHFFRAYYYYMLFRQYGGVLLIEKNFDPLKNPVKFPRASYEQMVEFITNEAQTAADILAVSYDSSNAGRVTKGAAYMLKAKTYLWASSEIFQNQSKVYLGFADDKSREMLDLAEKAYDELEKLKTYSLIKISGTTEEEIKNQYRNIFLTKNSEESILEVQHSDDGNFASGFGHKLDREASSPYYGGTTAAYTPTQNHVDEYEMRKGYELDPENPYLNRDYRFYANILYDGCRFKSRTMSIHYETVDGEVVEGEDLKPYGTSTDAAVTKTGYYLGKFVDEAQQIDNNDTYASKQNYIIWRYAEVILDYAEIYFRQGRTDLALGRINDIRRRAHMHELSSVTWEDIVHERRIEMAFEETTYWDLFRWGIAEEKMNGETNPLKVVKITYDEAGKPKYEYSNMNRYPKRVRTFNKRQYYLPIPWDEIRYHGIEQNPDWVEV